MHTKLDIHTCTVLTCGHSQLMLIQLEAASARQPLQCYIASYAACHTIACCCDRLHCCCCKCAYHLHVLQMTVIHMHISVTAPHVRQATNLQVSPDILKQQQQVCAPSKPCAEYTCQVIEATYRITIIYSNKSCPSRREFYDMHYENEARLNAV